ncbi:MAG: hypothetical protein ABI690_14875 [Chloroflexota bacterium]
MTTHENPLPRRANKTLLFSVAVGVIALAIYVWAFVNHQSNFLIDVGLVTFLVLIVCPVIVTIVAVRSTLKTIKSSGSNPPIRDYMMLVLRKCALLIAIDALVFIPIFAIFWLYTNLLFAAIFHSTQLSTNYNQQALEGLLTGVGLWGANLWAALLGVSFAIRWSHWLKASAATLVVLILTLVVIYWLEDQSRTIHLYFAVMAALLPYLLTGAGLWLLRSQNANMALKTDSAVS